MFIACLKVIPAVDSPGAGVDLMRPSGIGVTDWAVAGCTDRVLTRGDCRKYRQKEEGRQVSSYKLDDRREFNRV